MITLILKTEASHYDRYSCIGYQHICIGFYPLSHVYFENWNIWKIFMTRFPKTFNFSFKAEIHNCRFGVSGLVFWNKIPVRVFLIITQLALIDIAPWKLFCNCPLLKDISFDTKCLLVWCGEHVWFGRFLG